MSRWSDFQNVRPGIDEIMPGAADHDYYYHGAQLIDLNLSPAKVRAVEAVLWTVHTIIPHQQANLALVKQRRRLTLRRDNGLSVPLGLLPVVERLLRTKFHLSMSPMSVTGDVSFVSFARGPQGVIVLNGATNLGHMILWMAQVNPGKRIAVFARNVDDAKKLGAALRKLAPTKVAVLTSEKRQGYPRPITIATYAGLSSPTAGFSGCDILVYADIREALTYQGARFLVHRDQRLFAFERPGLRLGDLGRARKEVLFGFSTYHAYGNNRTLRRVTVDFLPFGPRIGVGAHTEPTADYYRRAVWGNQQRNDFIRWATGASLRGWFDLLDMPWLAARFHAGCTPLTAVLVESVPHWRALDLESRFRNWGVTGNQQMRSLSGLSRLGALWVLTQQDLLQYDRLPFDLIIRADGGGAGLDIPPRLLVAGSEDSQPLHIIDFADRFHPLARRLFRQRRDAYQASGLFTSRGTQIEGEVDHFIRRASRRHAK